MPVQASQPSPCCSSPSLMGGSDKTLQQWTTKERDLAKIPRSPRQRSLPVLDVGELVTHCVKWADIWPLQPVRLVAENRLVCNSEIFPARCVGRFGRACWRLPELRPICGFLGFAALSLSVWGPPLSDSGDAHHCTEDSSP